MKKIDLRKLQRIASSIVSTVLLVCVVFLTFEQTRVDLCNDTAEHVALSGEGAVSGLDDTKTKSQSPSAPDNPASHVCHCLHGHNAALASIHAVRPVFVSYMSKYLEDIQIPLSVSLDTPHRPPVFVRS